MNVIFETIKIFKYNLTKPHEKLMKFTLKYFYFSYFDKKIRINYRRDLIQPTIDTFLYNKNLFSTSLFYTNENEITIKLILNFNMRLQFY